MLPSTQCCAIGQASSENSLRFWKPENLLPVGSFPFTLSSPVVAWTVHVSVGSASRPAATCSAPYILTTSFSCGAPSPVIFALVVMPVNGPTVARGIVLPTVADPPRSSVAFSQTLRILPRSWDTSPDGYARLPMRVASWTWDRKAS